MLNIVKLSRPNATGMMMMMMMMKMMMMMTMMMTMMMMMMMMDFRDNHFVGRNHGVPHRSC